MPDVQAVTGPFSYTGKYIAGRLVDAGMAVRGFVRNLQVEATPGIDCRILQFSDSGKLAADLEGVSVLYNTYWIRFNRGGSTFDQAVQNTAILAGAARAAGVQRIVHISVSNASHDSPFPYFQGKAAAEDAIRTAGPASIIRPTLVFGREDILLNNIAWLLRRLHVFTIPGDGSYRLQPVFVGDVAELAVAEGRATRERVLDAAGPEVYTFKQLCRLVAGAVNTQAALIPTPPSITMIGGHLLSALVRDVILTSEEMHALMAETLVSHDEPTASTKLSEWLVDHGSELGTSYSSELKRHWSHPVPAALT